MVCKLRKKTLLILGMLLIGTILFYSAKGLQKQISKTEVNPATGSVDTVQQKGDNDNDSAKTVERDASIEDNKDIQTEPENKKDSDNKVTPEPSSDPKSSNSSSSGSSDSNNAPTGGGEQVQTPAPSPSQNGSAEKAPEKTPAPQKTNLKIIDTTNNDRIILQINVNYDGSTSLLNIMKNELKKANIQASYKGAYISSIDFLKERAAGPMSGWIFYVNGKTSSIGAGDYYPKQGDTITWKYWKNALEENNN
jgi:hypothetical protein